jgi:lysophospholipid acyltransferase (LPLAT)-like uncharacterized protein
MIALRASYSFRFIGLDNVKSAKLIGKDQSFMLALWHQTFIPGIIAQKGNYQKISGMGSRSKDANAASYATARIGLHVVRGSSSKNGVNKGGKEARDQMLNLMKQGITGALTIDGPKGPAKEVKPGIIDMAKKSGCAIVPYLVIPEKYWEFNSWDRFRIPKPFSKIIIHYGEPFTISKEANGEDFQAYCKKLQTSLLNDEKLVIKQFQNFHKLSKSNTW